MGLLRNTGGGCIEVGMPFPVAVNLSVVMSTGGKLSGGGYCEEVSGVPFPVAVNLSVVISTGEKS